MLVVMTRPARSVVRLLLALIVAVLLLITGILRWGMWALVGFFAELGVSGGTHPSRLVVSPARETLIGVARLHDGLARVSTAIHSRLLTIDRFVSRVDSALGRIRTRSVSSGPPSSSPSRAG